LISPQKRTARALEAIEEAVRVTSNTTAALWEEHETRLEQLLSCCQDSRRSLSVFRDDADLLLKKIEGMLVNIALQDEQRSEAHLSHFKQQKKFLEKILEAPCSSDNTVVSVKVLRCFKEKIEKVCKENYIEYRRSTTETTKPFVVDPEQQ
jgi:hypothetical protein